MDRSNLQAYDRKAVEAYLEAVDAEKARIRDEIVRREAAARERLAQASDGEQALGRVLVDAQREVAARRAEAAAAAQALLAEAEEEARQILGIALPVASPSADPVDPTEPTDPAELNEPDVADVTDLTHTTEAPDEPDEPDGDDDAAWDLPPAAAEPDGTDDGPANRVDAYATSGARGLLRRRRPRVGHDVHAVAGHDAFDDAYLASLRDALTDEALGPRLGTI